MDRRLVGEQERAPLGTPAGILIDSAGRLLAVEDRNRTLLMPVRDKAAAASAATIR